VTTDPARLPVVVGVGEVTDRPAIAEEGLDPAMLVAAALRAADVDAGGGFLARCDRVDLVPQISFRELDVPAALARELAMPVGRIRPAHDASGDTPVRLLDDAAAAISAGEARVCAVAGGEALRTAAARARGAGGELFAGSRRSAGSLRQAYGLVTPAEIYPLYEQATRAAWGQSLTEAQAETTRIWSLMSQVAAESEGAWLRTPRTEAEIGEAGPANRRVTHPYTKLMVANPSVNQGAALLVTSLATAREAGVPDDRLVVVGSGAAAHESEDPRARADFRTPPGMQVSLTRALQRNGLTVDDLDAVELYSCFPCVPKMARRVLGWPVDRPVTVHGGLTFGGGPIGDYMTHAAAAMVRRLRAGGGHGLVFANGGHCTHNHTLVLSRLDAASEERRADYDCQAEADARRGPIPPLTDAVEGAVVLETYVVPYDAAGAPADAVVVCRAPGGERVLARVPHEDRATIGLLVDGRREPVGTRGITVREDGRLRWSAADPR
jgi:acetyl-CoA C-acetyltransferase